MKKFNFDFSLDIWLQDIEIEAESYEEAKEKLLDMSAEDLVEKGYVKDFSIENLDCTEEEED